MRLIDADALKEYFFRPYSNEESYSNIDIEKVIDEQPTIEPEPQIVRCKDCKYYQTRQKSGFLPQCCWFDVLTKPNDYCSMAERRTDE